MPIPEDFYECRGFEERRAWMTRENKRRCEEAMARIKTDPNADLSDLAFLCDPVDGPKADESFEFNPPSR